MIEHKGRPTTIHTGEIGRLQTRSTRQAEERLARLSALPDSQSITYTPIDAVDTNVYLQLGDVRRGVESIALSFKLDPLNDGTIDKKGYESLFQPTRIENVDNLIVRYGKMLLGTGIARNIKQLFNPVHKAIRSQ